MKICIIWEQFEWGGVDSQISYMLNEWPVEEDTFIILANRNNAGARRLRDDLLIQENATFLETGSFFAPYFTSGLLKHVEKGLRHLFMPIFFVFSVVGYHLKIKALQADVVLCQNGGYPGAVGVLAAAVGGRLAGVPVQALLFTIKQ